MRKTVAISKSLDPDCINRLSRASTIQEAWKELLSVVHEFGFDHAIYATNRLRARGVFGDHSDSFMISDCPATFLDIFWTKAGYETVPVSVWVMQNSGSVSLRFGSDLYHGEQLSPKSATVQQDLMDAGVTSGYAIGYNEPNSKVVTGFGLINFGKSQEDADRIWEMKGEEIEAYCNIFHLKAANLPVPLKNKALTARQREVLTWVGAGKTTSEVATILGLSSAAIEKHLRRVREILNVSTTTQAVLHAQINSQIFSNSQDP